MTPVALTPYLNHCRESHTRATANNQGNNLKSPQQLDIAHNVSSRPLEHLSDETLRLLVENAKGLGDGQVVTD